MTFDNIKEMHIGSKKVMQAWLNGRQVYPSAKRIMDSLILWYDPGKQQCTNESMSANPVLVDLSGNGHDATCYNFAWKGMSGIGGYNIKPTSSNQFIANQGIIKYNSDASKAIITNTGSGVQKFWQVDVNIGETVPSYKIKITGITKSNFVIVSSDNSDIFINEDGEYTIPEYTNTSNNKQYPGLRFDENYNNQTCYITIEILPEYPNALVSDGVDDYVMAEAIPTLTNYMVISKDNTGIKQGLDGIGTIDGTSLTLLQGTQTVLYSLLLFDRDLTTDEIEWVKTNLIN